MNPKKSTALFCAGLALTVGIGGALQFNSDNQKKVTEANNVLAKDSNNINLVGTNFNQTLSNKGHEFLANSKNKPLVSPNAKVIEENEEITDLNVLFEKAKNGEQEFIDASKFKNEAEIHKIPDGLKAQSNSLKTQSNDLQDESFDLNVEGNYQTSQLLEDVENLDGTKVETYVVTNFVLAGETDSDNIPEANNDLNSNVTNLSNTNNNLKATNLNNTNLGVIAKPMLDKYDSAWDKTVGVKAYSRIYITKTTDTKGWSWLDLSKVTGGWKIDDNSYTLSDMRVRLAQIGVGTSSAVYETTDRYPSGLTFTYSAPSWPKISANTSGAGNAVVGAGQYVKVHHGASTWQFNWSNNY